MNKKRILIGSLVIFLLSTIYHNVYTYFPNAITSFLFPINESIFEHNKMILMAFITWTIIESLFMKDSPNPIFKNLVACVTCIILVLTFFPFVFFLILGQKENLIITLVIYALSILISLWLSEYIKLKHSKTLEYLSLVGFLILIVTFGILTFYHPDNILFKEFAHVTHRVTYNS